MVESPASLDTVGVPFQQPLAVKDLESPECNHERESLSENAGVALTVCGGS